MKVRSSIHLRLSSFGLLLAVALGGSQPTAWGQASISASPAEMHFVCEPGKSFADKIRIGNGGKSPFLLRAYAWDMKQTGAENQYGEIGTYPERSAASWITFSPGSLTVPGQKEESIQVTVSCPSGKAGSYSAILFTEMAPPEKKPGQTTIFLGGRLGILMTATMAPVDGAKGSLESLAIVAATAQEPGKIVYGFRNDGDVFLSPKGTILLIDSPDPKNPKVAARTDFEGAFIFPGNRREIDSVFTGNLQKGKRYHAIVTIELNDRIALNKNATMTCETDLSVGANNKVSGSRIQCR